MADTGFKFPATTGSPSNAWGSPDNLKADDGANATETTVGDKEDTATYGFSIAPGSTIDGIEVVIEGLVTGGTAGDEVVIGVALSWNGGTNYSAEKQQSFIRGDPVTAYTLGGATDTWGRAWSDADFSDANFRARLNYVSEIRATNAIGMDYIKVKVYYTAPAPSAKKLLAVLGVG